MSALTCGPTGLCDEGATIASLVAAVTSLLTSAVALFSPDVSPTGAVTPTVGCALFVTPPTPSANACVFITSKDAATRLAPKSHCLPDFHILYLVTFVSGLAFLIIEFLLCFYSYTLIMQAIAK